MTKFQNAILDSYELIVTESKNSPEAVSLIPIFAKGITQLDGISSEIKTLRIQQAKDLTGITEDKNELAEVVADYVIDVARAVHSYAISINNNTLQTKVDYKANKVHTMTKAKLIDAAGIVLEEARKIPAATLAEAGITADEMTQFATTYDQLKGTANGKREAQIDHSSQTDRIAELFAEAADLKKNILDRLATQFQRKAPEFYQKYKDASMVIYRHSPKSTAKTEVKA